MSIFERSLIRGLDFVFAYANDILIFSPEEKNYSSDGQVVRASASGAVHLGLIPSRVKPMSIKLAFTASLLDAQH